MKQFQTISVRVPKDLFKKIKEVAEKEHRSMNKRTSLNESANNSIP
jgi:predicted transcriptional regulator